MEKNTQSKGRIIKIAIVGPESTGKSVLAKSLAEHFETNWVPEFAREYLNMINRPYTKADLEIIAMEQLSLESRLEKSANRLLVCDTTLLVIRIWCEFKYGDCPEWIGDEVKHRYYDLHLLTATDIPWVPDPQREHPHKREYFYDLYRREIEKLGVEFVEIKGSRDERVKSAVDHINFLLRR